jgi:pyruvate/2-oxoglutarate dehydrogenase complex dihydrolipoamide acyltransferase (E2) component
MPRVADSTDTVYVEQWVVNIGQQVNEGDPLLAVETDKAVVTVPAPVSGVVLELLVPEQAEITTGEAIAVVEVT